eukprot:14425058-Alexandrium_andersonii.AAC.1
MAARGCCSPKLLNGGGEPGGCGGSIGRELAETQPGAGAPAGPPRAPGAPAGPGERQKRVPAGRG